MMMNILTEHDPLGLLLLKVQYVVFREEQKDYQWWFVNVNEQNKQTFFVFMTN